MQLFLQVNESTNGNGCVSEDMKEKEKAGHRLIRVIAAVTVLR